MCNVMRQYGRFDNTYLLLNEQATRKAVEELIRTKLPGETSPGDEIVFFWSGHGGRCACTDTSQKDGYREYLVPHDGRIDDLDTIKNTMLMDETFGRWMLDLDHRKILVILDVCYAGGQHNEGKSIGLPGRKAPRYTADGVAAMATKGIGGEQIPFDFFNFRRAKDLGQDELAMLASSRADQVSFERHDATCSVMTYYLVQCLRNARKPVTLKDGYAAVRTAVPSYVEAEFPGSTQTPMLIDHTTPPVYLRP